ncbi:MAG: 4-vinyl reductase [Chloroflexota bacterium]
MSNTLYYPNRFVYTLLQAMEEVMGQHGLDETLARAGIAAPPPDDLTREFPFEQIAALNAALDEMYGQRGGRGMALRAGRAWFAQGMKGFGALGGIGDPAFRRLSLEERVRLALQVQAEIFTRFSDQSSRLEVTPGALRFVIDASPFAWGRNAEKPVCHPLVGLIQECARWASNGRDYTVRETNCIATGDSACVIVINQ